MMDAEDGIRMKFLELKGTKLRTDLKASRVNKSYNNKHKDGSGNFGFVIVYDLEGFKDVGCGMKEPNSKWFQISGDYRADKEFYSLSFGSYSRPINRIPLEWNYQQVIEYMAKFIQEHMGDEF
jgi:hypothetical protein